MANTEDKDLLQVIPGQTSDSDSPRSEYPFSYAKGKRPLKELFGKYKDDPVFDEVWAEILRKHDEDSTAE